MNSIGGPTDRMRPETGFCDTADPFFRKTKAALYCPTRQDSCLKTRFDLPRIPAVKQSAECTEIANCECTEIVGKVQILISQGAQVISLSFYTGLGLRKSHGLQPKSTLKAP